MLTTLPTGRIDGSEAAIPVRTPTPDAVVVPLQYAVAVNSRRAPAAGAVGSTTFTEFGSPTGFDSRESNTLTSYSNTKPVTAMHVAASFLTSDPEMISGIIESADTLPAAAAHRPPS